MTNVIHNMLETLNSYKGDKDTLMSKYVEARLNKSFDLYLKELDQSLMYLTRKHEKSLVKRLNKLDDKII